jgi:hypothetical protein
MGVLDRAAGGALPTLLTIGLAIVGLFWQSQNISKWIHLASPRNASNGVARGPSGSP